MGLIGNFAATSKDRAVSKVLELAIEPLIGRYGKLVSLKLDTDRKMVELEILLHGETLPISVRIIDYSMITEGDRHFVTCSQVSVSREWMKILAEDLLQDKVFEIPSRYSKLLDILT